MRAGALLPLLAGCALPALPPPADLTAAQRTLAPVEVAPFAEAVAAEIGDAEAALTTAERAHSADPGSAVAAEDAYLARRAAEKAAAAERYQAAHQALCEARGTATRLAADLERRDQFFASLARRRAALTQAETALWQAHFAALTRASGIARLAARPDALVARFSAEDLFLPGTSLLRDGGEPRLGALAAALLSAPPFLVELAILDDAEGLRTAPAILAARRTRRVRDTLVAHGVPAAWFLPPVRHPPRGTQIDVRVVEPPLPLPPDDP